MSAIFALANQKGGVAKTTTTGILAAGLKKQGFSVLTIDCDPQGNLSMSVAAENQDSATMYEVMEGHGLAPGGHPAHTQLRYHSGQYHPCGH